MAKVDKFDLMGPLDPIGTLDLMGPLQDPIRYLHWSFIEPSFNVLN